LNLEAKGVPGCRRSIAWFRERRYAKKLPELREGVRLVARHVPRKEATKDGGGPLRPLRTIILVEAAVAGACNYDLAARHRGALAERGLALPRRLVEGGAAAACIGPRGRRWWE